MQRERAEDRLGVLEIGSYFVTNIGNIPIMTLLNSLLLIYYTDVIRLDPAAVGTLFLVARVLDGFNDPIVGYIVDHFPPTKMGRFRPYLMLGALFCSINYLALWYGPALFPSAKLMIAYVSYLLIGITFDLMDIPLNSLIPVITDNPKERNLLSTVKAAGYAVGGGLVALPAPFILDAMKDEPQKAYYLIIGVATAITLSFSVIGALGVRERIQPVEDKKYGLRDLFSVIAEKPVRVTFLTQLVSSIGGSAGGATGVFFAQYILHDVKLLSLLSVIGVIGGLPGLLLAPKLIDRFGKRAVYAAGMAMPVVFNLLKLINITNLPYLYILTILGGFGGGMTMPMSYGIQADNVDYVDYTRGQRTEGAIASLNSFVIKASGGIGGALPGYILKMTGYVPEAAEQSESAKRGILLNYIILPAISSLAAAALFRFQYPITNERMAEISETLKQRRAEAALLNEQTEGETTT